MTVFINDLIKSPAYKNTTAKLPIIMGVDEKNKIIINDLTKIPHLLIGGHAGTGKTMFLESVLQSLKTKLSEHECQFIIFDTKNNEFAHWANDKHLLYPIITNTDKITEIFDLILKMIDDRYQMFLECDAKNIWDYTAKTHKTVPAIVIIVDEFSDLMATNKKQTENFITQICRRARATGIHIIAATSVLNRDTITNTIKAYFAVRLGFKTRTQADSTQILGEAGAEKLLQCGDALYSDAGRFPVRICTPCTK